MVVEAGDHHGETLIADLCVRGVWLAQAEALFDIHIVDMMPSHISTILPAESC